MQVPFAHRAVNKNKPFYLRRKEAIMNIEIFLAQTTHASLDILKNVENLLYGYKVSVNTICRSSI